MEIPNRPWQRLWVDIFFQGEKWYLLFDDCCSKFLIIHSLPSLTSKDVISAVRSSISVFAIPDEIISDNGSQFVAKEYHDFAARYGFKLTAGSPHYSIGDGFIKRQVQAIKNVFNRCAEDGTDANLALLQLRATPLDSRTQSPGKLLQNRCDGCPQTYHPYSGVTNQRPILLAGKSVQPQAGVKLGGKGFSLSRGIFFGRNQSINILKFN